MLKSYGFLCRFHVLLFVNPYSKKFSHNSPVAIGKGLFDPASARPRKKNNFLGKF